MLGLRRPVGEHERVPVGGLLRAVDVRLHIRVQIDSGAASVSLVHRHLVVEGHRVHRSGQLWHRGRELERVASVVVDLCFAFGPGFCGHEHHSVTSSDSIDRGRSVLEDGHVLDVVRVEPLEILD